MTFLELEKKIDLYRRERDLLNRLENDVERLTGLPADYIRRTPICELRNPDVVLIGSGPEIMTRAVVNANLDKSLGLIVVEDEYKKPEFTSHISDYFQRIFSSYKSDF